jgi:pimeloyl-ACP methyl ester carboxylesterase
MEETDEFPFPLSLAGVPAPLAQAGAYALDAMQRSVLFWNTLRERGNIYVDQTVNGHPPVLIFEHRIIMDGRDLPRPTNFKLAEIVPPDESRANRNRRPIVVIDPRAGHGPGIGGSKRKSQIGMALEAGHPVYFILFEAEPLPGQTIADVEASEIAFIEEVVRRHPGAPKPTVIGNCQAGWALIMLSANKPGTTGPIVLNGSPVSYWAGIPGRDTMRYMGGLLGGAWPVAFLSDLGGGMFDGANLVLNFELLNWANTFWLKQYNLYAKVDTERERYLQFERWWNGFFHLTKEEIVFIVGNLFIGNKLEAGEVRLNGDRAVDLKEIKDPIVVFCSDGDNITPPQQALNWIIRVWESTGEIKRRQQVIVYVLHENIGHLGIFVSGKVAQREHKEIIGSYEMIDYLPPGLHEMVIEDVNEGVGRPPAYRVRFEERRIEDILALNECMAAEEENFPVVDAVSRKNLDFYEQYLSTFVRMATTPTISEFFRQMHPLRWSRYLISDLNPLLTPLTVAASLVRSDRRPVASDNPYVEMERATSRWIAESLDAANTFRSRTSELAFKAIYDRYSPSHYFLPELRKKRPSICRLIDERREKREFKKADRERWMKAMTEGGFTEGLIRLLLSLETADGIFDRDRFEKFQSLTPTHPRLRSIQTPEYRRIAREQARIVQTDRYWALKTLEQLLPTPEDREEVVAICREIFHDDEIVDESRTVMESLSACFLEVPAHGSPPKSA